MLTRPKHLPAPERRVATIEAVVALAADHNPSEITTTVIAKAMGLTQGALFKHFPSKDDLLKAVMDWVGDTLMARLDKAVAGVASPLTALEKLFVAHVEFVVKHPGVPRLVFGDLQRGQQTAARRAVQALLRRYGERVSALLAAANTRGELDEGIDIKAAVVLFIGTIQGLVMQSLISGDMTRIRRDAPKVFAIYRRGIEKARA